jgi:hypothetical protein
MMPTRGNAMRGTGSIAIGTKTVYGYYTAAGRKYRVRVSVDEADVLGLVAGLRVRVALPEKEAMDVLVTATSCTPPFVWAELEPLAPRASRAG